MSAQQQGENKDWLDAVWDALKRPVPGTSAPAWLRSNRLWIALNRPLFGTQRRPQPEPVWVEGRFSERQRIMSIVALFLLMGIDVWLDDKPLNAFLLAVVEPIDSLTCDPGLGGYSLGGEIFFAMLVLFLLLFMLPWVRGLVISWRMYRQQRTVPLGYRPWFRMRLLEGRVAKLHAVLLAMGSVLSLLLIFAMFMWAVPAFSKMTLVPPARFKECNPSHSPKMSPTEPLAPIPQEI